jgi:hypothetical protein
MIYEIINMSDHYTIEAKSLEAAFVACLLLGDGQYSFEPVEKGEGEKVPLFMMGGIKDWSLEHFGAHYDAVVARMTTEPEKRAELAECLDSCIIGNRATYLAASELMDPSKRDQWRTKWHDINRSSMNDIGGRAYKMAAKLREKGSATEPVPRQVFAR